MESKYTSVIFYENDISYKQFCALKMWWYYRNVYGMWKHIISNFCIMHTNYFKICYCGILSVFTFDYILKPQTIFPLPLKFI